jgi:hypothetical protein
MRDKEQIKETGLISTLLIRQREKDNKGRVEGEKEITLFF